MYTLDYIVVAFYALIVLASIYYLVKSFRVSRFMNKLYDKMDFECDKTSLCYWLEERMWHGIVYKLDFFELLFSFKKLEYKQWFDEDELYYIENRKLRQAE